MNRAKARVTTPLSVIIPMLNEAATLPRCIMSLAALPEENEIIFVDGGSSDESAAIVASFPRATVTHAGRGRALQMNHGARLAKGSTLLFLHADTVIPSDASTVIVRALEDPGVVAGSFRLRFTPETRLLRTYAWFTQINSLLTTFGDQGIFVRRNVFDELAGFADIDFMEDVELQRRLRRRGRFVKLNAEVTTSSRRFLARGIVRQQLQNIALVSAYLAGVNPNRLKSFYKDR